LLSALGSNRSRGGKKKKNSITGVLGLKNDAVFKHADYMCRLGKQKSPVGGLKRYDHLILNLRLPFNKRINRQPSCSLTNDLCRKSMGMSTLEKRLKKLVAALWRRPFSLRKARENLTRKKIIPEKKKSPRLIAAQNPGGEPSGLGNEKETTIRKISVLGVARRRAPQEKTLL